jgi:hypothetical protein
MEETEYLEFLISNRIHPRYSLKDISEEIQSRIGELKKNVLINDKKEKSTINIKDCLIIDNVNVMGIVPILREELELKDEIELNLIGEDNKFWKVVPNDLIIPLIKGFEKDFEAYKISNSKYSREMIDKARKTSKAFCYGDKPEIYLCWDKEKLSFKEDLPCLIVFERSMVFVLAPRVESE